MTKGERLQVFLARVMSAPSAGSAEAALAQVTEILDGVEDEYSGVPNDPTTPLADERIWPPIAKYSFLIEGRGDLDGYRQKGHETIIGHNGAILIRTRRTNHIILDKPGRDGRKVGL